MEIDRLIDEIVARVSSYLSDVERIDSSCTSMSKVLILAEHHSEICHELLDNTTLQKQFYLDCALQQDYHCDLKDYEAVVIYHLSIDGLSKLAHGISDTPWIDLAIRAILMGKKIFIPTDEMELFTYENTAPSAYYAMMKDKINLLRDSGVTFCKLHELEGLIMDGNNACKKTSVRCDKSKSNEAEGYVLCKKVITESDIRKISSEGVKKIIIKNNAILSDLAKEYIRNKQIEVVKDTSTMES